MVRRSISRIVLRITEYSMKHICGLQNGQIKSSDKERIGQFCLILFSVLAGRGRENKKNWHNFLEKLGKM